MFKFDGLSARSRSKTRGETMTSFNESLDRYITGNYGEDNYNPNLIEVFDKRFKGQNVVFQGVIAEFFIETRKQGFSIEEINECIKYAKEVFKCKINYIKRRLEEAKQ